MGVSQKRADWLQAWATKVIEAKRVNVKDMVAVLGRLSFAAGPLERLRPFLSTLYAWTAAVPEDATLPLPDAVIMVLNWLVKS